MTIKQFFESEERLVIHCDSEEKAIKLLKAFDNEGYRWSAGNRYTDKNYFNNFYDETCYSNKGAYDDRGWYESMGYKVIEFEDIEI